jgi:hypothetical protein
LGSGNSAGTTNRGNGGGTGDGNGQPFAGGSGVVILRYSASYTIDVGAGLTASTNTVGSDKVTTFTAGTGTITFS